MPVHARELLVARPRVRGLRVGSVPGLEVRAVHLPAHRDPLARPRPPPPPAGRGCASTRVGSSSVRSPRLSELVGALAYPAEAGREDRAGARELDRQSIIGPAPAPCAARPRGPCTLAVELAAQRLLQRAAERGPSGMPGASRSSPVISSRTRAQVRQPAEDRLRGRAQASASASVSGGSQASSARSSRGRALALAQLRHELRRRARGAQRRRRGRGASSWRPLDPGVERVAASGRPAPRAPRAPRSAPIARRAERRRGHQLRIGRRAPASARSSPRSRMRRPRAGASCSASRSSSSSRIARARDRRRARPSPTASRASALGLLVHPEAQARLVADGPQQPRRVVDERALRAARASRRASRSRAAAVGVVQVAEVVAAERRSPSR